MKFYRLKKAGSLVNSSKQTASWSFQIILHEKALTAVHLVPQKCNILTKQSCRHKEGSDTIISTTTSFQANKFLPFDLWAHLYCNIRMHCPILISSYPHPFTPQGARTILFKSNNCRAGPLYSQKSWGWATIKQTLENLEIKPLISLYWAQTGKIFPTTCNLVNYFLYCYPV